MDKAEYVFNKYAGFWSTLKNIGRKSTKYIKDSIKGEGASIARTPTYNKLNEAYSGNQKFIGEHYKTLSSAKVKPVTVWNSEQKAQGLAVAKIEKELGL